MTSRKKKLFVAVAILIVYIASYMTWSRIALAKCDEFGLVGYCFLYAYEDEMFSEEHVFWESTVQWFYFPRILLDVEVIGGIGPANPPTTSLS